MTVRSSAVALAREAAFAPAEGHRAYCAGVAGAAMPIIPPSTAPRGDAVVTSDVTGVVTVRGRRMRAPGG